MSLYNMLFSTNENSAELLRMIGLDSNSFVRFRDCYLNKDGSVLIVYTRLGGGNREYYEETIDFLRDNKYYLKDYDEEYDTTYAYFEFKIPSEYLNRTKELYAGEDPKTIKEKFEEEFTKLDNDDPEALERSNSILNKITEAIKNNDTFIGL